MAARCQDQFTFTRPDLIIPVPLHPKRLRWRGFNQAAMLAREVSRVWRVPLDPCVLLRVRQTQPQTELKRDERRANVRNAFVIKPGRSVRGLNLLLLDDIYTSGATVNEGSRTLRRGGARSVQVLTLARTV